MPRKPFDENLARRIPSGSPGAGRFTEKPRPADDTVALFVPDPYQPGDSERLAWKEQFNLLTARLRPYIVEDDGQKALSTRAPKELVNTYRLAANMGRYNGWIE